MSGPKVVRIVTREEVLALCGAALARVDAAISHWERVGGRSGILDQESRVAVRNRRAQLQSLLESEQFTQLQKIAPLVEDWLVQDLEKRLEEQASSASRARRARRQLATTAASVLAACNERRLALPAELRATLESAWPATDDEQITRALEGAVNRAFALLATAKERAGPSQRQRELATRLSEGHAETTLDQWLQAHAPPVNDPPFLDAVERQLGQLSALAGAEATWPYYARLEEIRAWPDDPARALQIDALALALKGAICEARETLEIARSAAAARAQALAMGLCEASTMPAEAARETRETGTPRPLLDASLCALETSLADSRLKDARTHLATVQAQLQAAAQAHAAAARRDVLLRGLAELGYDVREGMSTTWSEQGRLVVATPGRTGFGVELGGSGERLQVRVVGFEGTPHTPASDQDAEVSWCTQVSQLHHVLSSQGATLQVERATAPGIQPVRMVPAPLHVVPHDDYYEEDDHAAPRAMTRD